MSHTLAARCTVCGVTDDAPCPECGTSSAATHGVAEQKPWKSAPDPNDGYVHQWHPDCLPTPTQGETR